MNENEYFGETEAVAHMLATFLALVDKGGIREGVAGLYRLVSALPSAADDFPTAMATIEAWLGRESSDTASAKE